jgi:protein-disulfide isomerase/peroxiredoxin/uncharacterized membrane protein
MTRLAHGLFIASCLAAAAWSTWLVHLHQQAVAHALEPGLLCGAEGGCGDVLASSWSTILGVPVNAPAVGAYLALAALGALSAAGRLDRARVAAVATLSSLLGLVYGGGLLVVMLGVIGVACPYCLVADALHLLVLATAPALHPRGPGAALRELGSAAVHAARGRFEVAVPVTALLVAPILVSMFPEPGEDERPIEVITAEELGRLGEARPTGETRRLVIPADAAEIPIGPDTPVRGPADAPVTIAVFEDFQCPFCRTLSASIEALAAERPVRVAWFHYPMDKGCNEGPILRTLHDRACAAAMAATCAQEQGRFWEMHDRLFHDPRRLGDRDLLEHALALGLDEAAFRGCMAARDTHARVVADTRVGAALRVTGTPAFFINGRRFGGGLPTEMLRAAVDAILAESTPEAVDVAIEGEIVGPVGDAPAAVRLDGPAGPFSIDAFEASVVGGAARSAPGVEPARGLSWFQARDACEAAGRRLCTEAEWLFACAGAVPEDDDGDGWRSDEQLVGRAHPYGAWGQLTWCASARTPEQDLPVITGEHPRCRTPEGVYDLEGLTKEWVGLSPDRAAVKGGSYFSGDSARCAYLRTDLPPDTAGDESVGFRCCEGPVPAEAVATHHPGGKVGDALLDFTLPTLDGGTLRRADLAGKPVILTFWASWCGPCRKEMPALEAAWRRHEADGLVVIGVNLDQEPLRAAGFLRTTPVGFPIALDPDSALFSRFDAAGVPTTFWITRSGRIRQRTVGYDEARPELLDEAVRALLAAE